MNIQRVLKQAVTAVTLGAMLAAPLLAPVPALAKSKKPQPIDITKLVWPPAPAPTRLRFIAEFHGEDVKGIKKQGILERLAGVEDLQSKSYMVKPYGVAVDSKGRAFISDTILKLVFVLDFEKKQIEYRGEKAPANFALPMGLAIGPEDRLFVADATRHAVTAFDADGKVLAIFGEKELQRPVGVAVDAALDRLYVADVKEKQIAQFNLTSFEFERWVGAKALASPTNLVVDPDGLLYVVDTFTNRVVVFDSDGEFVRTFGETGLGAGKFMRPRGIAIDPDGHVYVSDAFFNLFQIMSAEGQPLIPVGRGGIDPGTFHVPAAMTFDKSNRLFVVDEYNRRVQIFHYTTDAELAAAGKRASPEKKAAMK